MWQAMTRASTVPVALHLDHCPDREAISACLAQGWNSVLFDASRSVEENERQMHEVVAEARRTAPMSKARSKASKASRTASAPTRSDGPVARRALDVHPGHRHRLLRAGDRQRPRDVRRAPQLDAQRVTDIVAEPIRSRCTADGRPPTQFAT